MKTKVITHQTATGDKINLTLRQIHVLNVAEKWPKNQFGEEYAIVSHGAPFWDP